MKLTHPRFPMRRRLFYLVPVAVVLLLVGSLLPVLFPRRCPVTKEAFERIEEGMTRAEVEAILAGPPGDYRTRPQEEDHILVWFEVWRGDEGTAGVMFDDAGVVTGGHFFPANPVPVGPIELARWRLRRARDRWTGGGTP